MSPRRSLSRRWRFFWMGMQNRARLLWLRLWHGTGLAMPGSEAWRAVFSAYLQEPCSPAPSVETQLFMEHAAWVLQQQGRKRALDACDAELAYINQRRIEVLLLKARLSGYPP